MPQKGRLIIIALLFSAFAWGYKQDALVASWRSWREPAPQPPPAEQTTPTTPPAVQPVTPNNTALYPTTPNNSVVIQPENPAVASDPVPPAQNTGEKNALSDTLDSIRPGQIQQNQIVQRNAYFEKLSQQLRDLQGGAPNAPAPQAPGDPSAQMPPPVFVPPNQPVPLPGADGNGGGPSPIYPNLPPNFAPQLENQMPPPPGGYTAPPMPPSGLDQTTPNAPPEETDDDEEADDEADDSDKGPILYREDRDNSNLMFRTLPLEESDDSDPPSIFL